MTPVILATDQVVSSDVLIECPLCMIDIDIVEISACCILRIITSLMGAGLKPCRLAAYTHPLVFHRCNVLGGHICCMSMLCGKPPLKVMRESKPVNVGRQRRFPELSLLIIAPIVYHLEVPRD